MTPEEKAKLSAEHRAQTLRVVNAMDPVTARLLLVRMIEQNDPPGLWQRIAACGFVQLPVQEDS